jgi:hypothetical protein
MKRLLIAVVGLLVFNSSARADDGGMMQGQMQHKGMKMDQQGSMPSMCPMMGDHTMPMKNSMKDMMQSMIDMMKMQQKMMKGVKPAEKRAMMIQMDKKIDQMEKMMTDMPCMQNQNSPSGHDHDSMEK